MTLWQNKVLQLVAQIPVGKVTTYKILALRLGKKGLARAVGTALNKNPHLLTIPCHRVIKSNGQIGDYRLGLAKKGELLQNDGVMIKRGKIASWQRYLYDFKKSK